MIAAAVKGASSKEQHAILIGVYVDKEALFFKRGCLIPKGNKITKSRRPRHPHFLFLGEGRGCSLLQSILLYCCIGLSRALEKRCCALILLLLSTREIGLLNTVLAR